MCIRDRGSRDGLNEAQTKGYREIAALAEEYGLNLYFLETPKYERMYCLLYTSFAKTMLKLSETNDAIGVVMDQVGTPTSAAELAKAIRYLLPTDNYGLFHGTCEGDTNWAEFAAAVLKLSLIHI